MIRDLDAFGIWLKCKVGSCNHKRYMGILTKWSAVLNGKEPSVRVANAYLSYLYSQSVYKPITISLIVRVLNKYLFDWKCIEPSAQRLHDRGEYNDYQRSYCARFPRREYSQAWFEHKAVDTKVDGKRVWLTGLYKRPKTDVCELCNKPHRKLDYHHWDKNNPSKGLWLCVPCHVFAESLERGVSPEKYIDLKEFIELESRGATEDEIAKAKAEGTYLQLE